MEEQLSHKYMVMAKRKHFIIPCINSINLLPNVKDLHMHDDIADTIDLRERYASIVLLLFFPYHDAEDLHINDSYWEKYKTVISNNGISCKSLEVIKKIQDVSYNCSQLQKLKDELETTTVFTPHESDNMAKYKDNEITADVNEMAEMFKQLDDTGLEDSNPDKRSLSKIGERHHIVEQKIPSSNLSLPDITNIPDGITFNATNESKTTEDNTVTPDGGETLQSDKGTFSLNMIIDILSEVVLNQMTNNKGNRKSF